VDGEGREDLKMGGGSRKRPTRPHAHKVHSRLYLIKRRAHRGRTSCLHVHGGGYPEV